MNLPKDQRYSVTFEVWEPLLPHNLLSRLHIPMRDIAEFTGHTEEEIKELVKAKFYPKEILVVGGQELEVPVRTRKLSEQQARKVEAEIHNLAHQIGFPLTAPRGNSDL
jgi:hypothetical protein